MPHRRRPRLCAGSGQGSRASHAGERAERYPLHSHRRSMKSCCVRRISCNARFEGAATQANPTCSSLLQRRRGAKSPTAQSNSPSGFAGLVRIIHEVGGLLLAFATRSLGGWQTKLVQACAAIVLTIHQQGSSNTCILSADWRHAAISTNSASKPPRRALAFREHF